MTANPLSNPINKPFVPIYWTGASGTRYEFQLDTIGAVYRPIEGVYIFCWHTGNGNYSAAYVGETDNFQRRLTSELRAHHSFDAVRLRGATHISTLHVAGDRSYRLYVETDLRNALNPPCNKQ
jgi:hypothetical protein